ncbi:UNVERIFIED_CONTAM: hypothetical protein FKN15_056175 [Acipenser sinensis]
MGGTRKSCRKQQQQLEQLCKRWWSPVSLDPWIGRLSRNKGGLKGPPMCDACREFGHDREDCPYGDPQYEEAWNQGLVGDAAEWFWMRDQTQPTPKREKPEHPQPKLAPAGEKCLLAPPQPTEEISWEAFLCTVEASCWCPICRERGHTPLNCPLLPEGLLLRPVPPAEGECLLVPPPPPPPAEGESLLVPPSPPLSPPLPPAEEEYLLVPHSSPTPAEGACLLVLPPLPPPAEGACLLVSPLQPEGEAPLPPSQPEGEAPLPPSQPEGEAPLPPSQPEGEAPLPPSQPEGEEPLPPSPGAEQQELPLPPPPSEGEEQELPLPPPSPPEGEEQELPLPPPPPPEGEEQELPLPSRQYGLEQEAGGPQPPLHRLLSRARGKPAGRSG